MPAVARVAPATLAPATQAAHVALRPLSRPRELACEYGVQAWTGSPIALHAGVNGQRFAAVPTGWQVAVVVPLGETESLFVHAEHEGAMLEGWVSPRELPLFATRAETFHGFASPSGDAPLVVREGEAGALVTTLGIEPEVATVPTALDTLAATCDFFALAPSDFVSATARPGVSIGFNAGPVVLLDAPKGQELLRFGGGDSTPMADLLESRGAWRRIRWSAASVEVIGWVSAARVRRDVSGAPGGALWGRGSGGGSVQPTKPSAFRWSEQRCPVAVDLWMADGSVPIAVGKVAAGALARFGPPRADGSRAYSMPTDTLRVEDAKLFVDAAAASRCK